MTTLKIHSQPIEAGLLVALALALPWSCGGPAATCQSDADCADGFFCSNSVCDVTDSASSTAGESTTGPADITTSGFPSSGPTSSSTTDPVETEDSTGLPPGCTLNSQCAEEQRCDPDGGVCVDLISAECDTVVWPDDRDNVEFIGLIIPTSPPFDTLMQPLENAALLAIQDFNGVASLQGGRKIAWVGCDSTGGADVAVAAAEHLRDNVRAPAIVGPIFSEAARAVAEQVTVPAEIFVISPTASATSLSDFEDNNLLWRVTPNDIYQGNALVDRFTNDLSVPPARMLVLNKDDAYGNELQQLIAADLVTGLAPATVHFADYQGPENYATQEALLAAYGEVISQALVEPGVVSDAIDYDSPDDHYTHILIIGTSEAEAFILSYAGIWGQFYSFAPFPLITVTHGAVPTLEGTVATAQATPGLDMLAPLLQAMLRGTSPNIFDLDNFTAFNIRYQIAFGGPALTSSSLSYDAAMAAIFAMVTVAEDEEVTGPAIATGMARLSDPKGTFISFGEPVNVFVQAARNTLASGNTVDLQGVSGALDWDPSNGELRADVLGWNVGNGLLGEPVQLSPGCLYALDPEPAFDGTWVSAATGMPPCD